MGSRFAILAAAVLGLGWAGPALVQEARPDFQTCMNIAVAGFEQDLRRMRHRPEEDRAFDIGDLRQVDYCGSVGIVLCDRSEAPLVCQRALTKTQEEMRAQVLAPLPAPLATEADDFAQALYERVWWLTQSGSAGPDCAGQPEVFEIWCETREANRRLQDAVLLWQVARFLGVAGPAIDAGWAQEAPPVRPRQRPKI